MSPVPMDHHEKMRLRAAAFSVTRLYPGPVGEVLSRELLTWEEFGTASAVASWSCSWWTTCSRRHWRRATLRDGRSPGPRFSLVLLLTDRRAAFAADERASSLTGRRRSRPSAPARAAGRLVRADNR